MPVGAPADRLITPLWLSRQRSDRQGRMQRGENRNNTSGGKEMKVIAEYVSDHPANDLLRIYIAGNQKQRNEFLCTIWADDFYELLDDKQAEKWDNDSTYFYNVPKNMLLDKAYWINSSI